MLKGAERIDLLEVHCSVAIITAGISGIRKIIVFPFAGGTLKYLMNTYIRVKLSCKTVVPQFLKSPLICSLLTGK